MMVVQVVGKRGAAHLPRVKSCEVEQDPLGVAEVVLVLLFDRMQALLEA
jgi:hypothetical protein